MKGKSFILTAFLTGLGTLLFAQTKFVFSPTTIPDGLYGSPYTSQTLTVAGGMPPYTFSISSGRLPAGMALSSGGILSGTPTAAGKYSFTVKAEDKTPGPGPGMHSGSQNYTLIVDPAVLTITANNTSMTYGGTVPSLSASFTGFVNGDDPSSLMTQPKLSTPASAASPAGTYTITASGATDPNYTFTYQTGTMTVRPASLTVAADNKAMPLGGPLPILTVSYAGFVNGDNASNLTTSPTITTTATSSSPAGTYPISASGAKDPNYDFTYMPGTLSINAATVHVTANAQTIEYGTPDPTFTYSVSGLPNGNNAIIFTGSLSRLPGEDVGTYPITIGSLSAGSNYTISYTGNFLTITKDSQQITWSQSLSVGCNSTSQVRLTATASSNLAVTYSVSDTSVATVSGNVLTLLKSGTAVVTAAQAGDADYNAATAVADTVLFESTSLIAQHWNDVIFFDNSSGDYVQWQWYKNGVAVAGDTTSYYSETPSLNGQYYVIATNKDGQQVQSCALTVTAGAAIAGGIKVSPNPASKGAVVTVVCNYTVTALQGAVVQIADISGRILQQITNVQPSMQVTMPSASGIYIVNLVLANGQRISTNVLIGG
jgi:MBG domain (YGX type)